MKQQHLSLLLEKFENGTCTDAELAELNAWYHSFSDHESALEDDLTSPAAGKAKVRFFHLNSYMAATVPLKVTVKGTTVVKDNLVFGEVTEYLQVDPGAKFSVTSTGITTPLSIDDANLIAGKVYTIWLGGTSSSILDSHVILTN